MRQSDVEKIVAEAIQNKRVVEVVYHREDGKITKRLVEPFDVNAKRGSRNREKVFWGWCLFHNKIEQRKIPRIISMSLTDLQFDPKVREKTFKTLPHYRIPRPEDWYDDAQKKAMKMKSEANLK
jgi:predicted DNA-binding transcriptional regulator YafY